MALRDTSFFSLFPPRIPPTKYKICEFSGAGCGVTSAKPNGGPCYICAMIWVGFDFWGGWSSAYSFFGSLLGLAVGVVHCPLLSYPLFSSLYPSQPRVPD